MSIQRIPGYIAFCDNGGCLCSVEDAAAESADKLLKSLTTTGQDPWKQVGGKLYCYNCWKEEENEANRDRLDREEALEYAAEQLGPSKGDCYIHKCRKPMVGNELRCLDHLVEFASTDKNKPISYFAAVRWAVMHREAEARRTRV